VSIWLADFGRQRLRDEGWAGLVTGRHVVGAITNPTIFATAITGSGARTSVTVSNPASGL
jgi:hypothetical protein